VAAPLHGACEERSTIQQSPDPSASTRPSSQVTPAKSRRMRVRILAAWQRVPAGWRIGLTFLALFWALTLVRAALPEHALSDSRWLVLVAALAVVPALLDHLRPTLSRVNIAGLLEMTFEHPEKLAAYTESISPDDAVALRAATLPRGPTEYDSVMSEAERLTAARPEVLLLDLGGGRTWWFPNLYVLLQLLRRSAIATIAFVEDSAGVGAFVGACSLENLLAALESRMPEFTAAAQTILSGRKPLSVEDFEKLAKHAQGEQLYGQWVTGATLRERLPGLVLDDGTVEWREALPPGDVRMIVIAAQRFWGVTRAGRLDFLLDRDKLALTVARKLARQTP
jgi:hypothetical protein